MGDQVAKLLANLPAFKQIGRPPTCPFNIPGSAACADNETAEIIRIERGIVVTPAEVRAKTGRADQPCRGLRPIDVLQALIAFRVRGYGFHSRVTASDAMKATDRGVVLVGVGYSAWPRQIGQHGPGPTAEIGGKTDIGFTGAHATTLWGRRYWSKAPATWDPARLGAFRKGWRVWARDPDHHQDWNVPYDRFLSEYLGAAMEAIKRDRWTTTFMISKG